MAVKTHKPLIQPPQIIVAIERSENGFVVVMPNPDGPGWIREQGPMIQDGVHHDASAVAAIADALRTVCYVLEQEVGQTKWWKERVHIQHMRWDKDGDLPVEVEP